MHGPRSHAILGTGFNHKPSRPCRPGQTGQLPVRALGSVLLPPPEPIIAQGCDLSHSTLPQALSLHLQLSQGCRGAGPALRPGPWAPGSELPQAHTALCWGLRLSGAATQVLTCPRPQAQAQVPPGARASALSALCSELPRDRGSAPLGVLWSDCCFSSLGVSRRCPYVSCRRDEKSFIRPFQNEFLFQVKT